MGCLFLIFVWKLIALKRHHTAYSSLGILSGLVTPYGLIIFVNIDQCAGSSFFCRNFNEVLIKIEMDYAVEIFAHGNHQSMYLTQSMPWLLMTWWCKEPGHQQPWYWPISPRMLQSQHQKGLTHWGRVTHICVSKLNIIGSDNGLSPGRCQAINWTNAGILLIGPLGTHFNEILIAIHTFSFKKIHLKMSSGKWRPFCLGLNVLTTGNSWRYDNVCVSIVAADALVLKHQSISILKTDLIPVVTELTIKFIDFNLTEHYICFWEKNLPSQLTHSGVRDPVYDFKHFRQLPFGLFEFVDLWPKWNLSWPCSSMS